MARIIPVIVFLTALIPASLQAADMPSTGQCRRVDAASDGWTHPDIGAHAGEIWISRPTCHAIGTSRRPYHAVSGGFRFEGIWGDTSMVNEWQGVGNEPYQSVGNGPVDGWQCTVLSTGSGHPPRRPDTILCAVTCCP